nr:MAG TPA: Protein of unknown function (DUF551) [Bacteriophage sp.]
MKRMTYVTEKGEILFHPKDLPDDEGMTITQLAKDGRFKALEIIAESLANHEQAEEYGRYGKWIPVSERLPEESLNSVIGWDTYRNRCCFVQYLGGRFVLGDDIDIVNVTAWMPLPEPYRESEVDNGEV